MIIEDMIEHPGCYRILEISLQRSRGYRIGEKRYFSKKYMTELVEPNDLIKKIL